MPGEAPRDYVHAHGARKGAGGPRQQGERLPVLAADTTVVLDGRIFGKPRDRADAVAHARPAVRPHPRGADRRGAGRRARRARCV